MPNSTIIVKANGEREPFVPDKLYTSLVRSGAARDIAEQITATISSSIHEGDKTRDIYNRAFRALRAIERPVAARYSVKRALLELGPSGYPFEDYVSEIFRAQGYLASTRVIVSGKCVEHELDIIATRDDERLAAEVKYHNNPGLKSDIKVALYVRARYEDIAAAHTSGPYAFTTPTIITNTKFTQQAELYAACAGISLISWDYPEKGNLRELIEETKVHPISCITTLSKTHKRRLLEQGIVLCRQVREHTRTLESLGLAPRAIDRVLGETESLCPVTK